VNAWYRYSGIFFLLVSAVVLQQSIWVLRIWEDGQPGSGFMPLHIGLGLAILSVALIVKHRRRDAEHRPFWEGRAWLQPLVAVAIVAVFIVVFDDIGAIVSVAVLVTGWLWLVSRKRIWVAAVTGAVTAAIVHLVFERLLQTPFPRGLLF
jgi:cell division protein FtsW (lipid II flippase)